MLSSIRNKFKTNKFYEDISTLYDIVGITDNCILIKKLNIVKQIHVYKVEPVMILNITESISKNIINAYTEFLRSMNCNFQIYIENTEVNINNYFDNMVLDDNEANKNKLIKIYKEQLEKSLNENNIHICNFYIILTIEDEHNVDEISKNIYNLCKTGVSIEKIKGKTNFESFLYSKVNKVDNIW